MTFLWVFFIIVSTTAFEISCDIDIYDAVQTDTSKPYVVRNYVDALSEEFKDSYTFENINRTLHNVSVPTMAAYSFPHEVVEKTFHDYLIDDVYPFMTFEVSKYNKRMLLPVRFERGKMNSVIPSSIRNLHKCDYMKHLYSAVEEEFYIGSAGQGANFHKHMEIYNQVVHGKKIWFLAFNEGDIQGIAGEKLLADNINSVINNKNIKRCTLEENDLIFVPMGIYHATFNLKPTLAAACFPFRL